MVMVVVDRLTKSAHFSALVHSYTTRKVAEIFVKEIARLHGMPSSIVSDRDPIFMSHFWQEYFKHISKSWYELFKNQKMAQCFFGPFQIPEKVGAVAYKLDLPESSRVHPISHVSNLRARVGPVEQFAAQLPESESEAIEPAPEKVLARRRVKHEGQIVTEVLVS
ncbi:uncharacterized protein [Typha latifolia]|uniref:uncharacterized protein n=1 Tax=Typha latifolia TaxID=4733 RepID=UPI003C2AE218